MGEILMSEKESRRIHIFEQVKRGAITLVTASKLLGLGYRQAKRLWKSYKKKGIPGLISQKRGKPSNRQFSTGFHQEIVQIINAHYLNCKPTFITEKLEEEHGVSISSETTRKLMIKHGLWFPKRKRANPHQRRNRRECEGELVQTDASEHAWFEDRGPKCHLHLIVDDATSKCKGGYFAKGETTTGYYMAFKTYFEREGIPVSIYCDKRGTFKVNKGDKNQLTQFSRAMKELNIRVIFAHSAPAKGRIERTFGTFQDRLICEMRLQRISTIEEANKFLPSFIEKYNAKFGKAPSNPFNAHHPLNSNKPLKYILCFKYKRTVTKNLEISFENEIYQLQPKGVQNLKKAEVDVIVTLEGEMRIEYQGKGLKFKRYTELSPMKQNIAPQEEHKKLKIINLHSYSRWDNNDLFNTISKRGYKETDDILTQEERRLR
jgi:transposase